MKFTIDDKDPEVLRKCPTHLRVEQFLAALADGKLITAVALANHVGLSHGTVMRVGHLISRNLSVNRGNKKFYGNPKTIQAFKKHYQLQD